MIPVSTETNRPRSETSSVRDLFPPALGVDSDYSLKKSHIALQQCDHVCSSYTRLPNMHPRQILKSSRMSVYAGNDIDLQHDTSWGWPEALPVS